MENSRLRALTISLTASVLVTTFLLSGTATALDWRLIRDEMRSQAREVYPRGRVLLARDFQSDRLGDYPGHPGVKLVKDPDGKGKCAQFSSSEYRLKDIPVGLGHWIMVGWKARNVSGNGKAYLEVIYKDAEGKTLFVIGRHNLKSPLPRRQASAEGPEAGWKQEVWSLNPSWRSGPTLKYAPLYAGTRSVSLRFFHEPDDETMTLIDDIRVVDIQPVVLKVVADKFDEQRRGFATAMERIRGLPDSPEAGRWKQAAAAHSNKIASELKALASQGLKSDEFIHGSDAPLLFIRRLADAVEAVEKGLTQPGTILTYRTKPFPVLGSLGNAVRKDPVGVLPYASEFEGELAKEVTIQACRGEYEPISIALWSPDNIDQVAVCASDLKGPDGLIAASNLDIKVVKWWYQRNPERPEWLVQTPRFLVNDDSLLKVDRQNRRNYLKLSFPEGSRYVDPSTYSQSDEEQLDYFPLRDSDLLQPFDLVAGENKQIWVTVKVPEEAAAGQYAGDITFKAGGREVARMTVRLRVLPFTLPTPKTRYDSSQDYTFSLYYWGWLKENGKGKVGHSTKSEEQLRFELRMMYEHGIVAPLMLMYGHYPGSVRPEARFRKHLEMMRETGMSGRPLYLGENVSRLTDEGVARLRKELPSVIAIVREYGFTDVYFYGQDEAGGELLRTKQTPTWRMLHEIGAKAQTSVTYDNLDDVPDELDLLIAVPPLNQHRAALRHRLGHKIHCYGFPMSSTADPLPWRRNYGFGAWSRDYDGVTPFCFMHNGKGIWNELEGPLYNIAFPTVNGAISTLALEAFREGADDVRYATLLMKKLEESREKRTPEARELAEKVSQWIGGVDFLTADPDLVRTRMVDFIWGMTGGN